MVEDLPAFLTFLADRFSFRLLPCFLSLDFWGDLSDMMVLPRANVTTRGKADQQTMWDMLPRPHGGAMTAMIMMTA